MASQKSKQGLQNVYLDVVPSDGQKFLVGSTVSLSASAYTDDGSTIIRTSIIRIPGGEVLATEEGNFASTQIRYDSQGVYRIEGTAFNGLIGGNLPVAFSIHGGPGASTGVSITKPASGQTYIGIPGAIDIEASVSTAENDERISRVEFHLNERNIGQALSAPYNIRYEQVTAFGSYELKAKMILANNSGEFWSDPITFHVVPRKPTGIELTAPEDGAEFTAPASIALQAKLTGGTGDVNYVRFFHGSTKIWDEPSNGSDTYQYNWQNLLPGTYQNVRAVVFLNDGSRLDSQNITFRVSESGSPTAVEFVTPTEGQEFTAPGPIPLKANLIGGTEGVEYVRFLYGGTKITDVYQAPYEHDWSHSIPGSYRLRAVAILTDGSRLQDEVNIRILA